MCKSYFKTDHLTVNATGKIMNILVRLIKNKKKEYDWPILGDNIVNNNSNDDGNSNIEQICCMFQVVRQNVVVIVTDIPHL